MPTDPSLTPPRRKSNALWWIIAAFALLVAAPLFRTFGPNPPIRVAKETTFITEPLGPDGLPDFRRYLLDEYREGVTADNNAAVLLWQALRPRELSDAEFEAARKEIGLTLKPATVQELTPLEAGSLRSQIDAWLATQRQLEPDAELCDRVLEVPLQQPWTGGEFPPLQKWLEANRGALDLVVEASHRPCYYAPPLSLIGASDAPLVLTPLPGLTESRDAAKCLLARAMWQTGEKRPKEAWNDITAIYRLSRLVGQGHSIIEGIMSVTLNDLACTGTIALLHHGELTPELIARIRHDLDAQPDFDFAFTAIDQFERISGLDVVVRLTSRNSAALWLELAEPGSNNKGGIIDTFSIDWNHTLREINVVCDELVTATRLPLTIDRTRAAINIQGELEARGYFRNRGIELIASLFSRNLRNRIAADTLVFMLGGALPVAINVQERANTQLRMTRAAAALAAFRAEHGAYPATLAELAPFAADSSVIDPFSSDKPLVYRADSAGGYLLYSVFYNGLDDGGTDGYHPIVEGEWVLEKPPIDYFYESDYVMRVPRPAFAIPKPIAE
jgi:hypothetical protein